MNLVVFLGGGKEGLGQISALINRAESERVIVVKDKNVQELIQNERITYVNVDLAKEIITLRNEMRDKLKKELSGDFEVAVSIASGNGKEHMALISALLSIPVGIKLVVYTKNGIEFIN